MYPQNPNYFIDFYPEPHKRSCLIFKSVVHVSHSLFRFCSTSGSFPCPLRLLLVHDEALIFPGSKCSVHRGWPRVSPLFFLSHASHVHPNLQKKECVCSTLRCCYPEGYGCALCDAPLSASHVCGPAVNLLQEGYAVST